MGLTDSQIAKVRSCCSSITDKISNVQSSCEGLTNILQHNGDYYYFKIGTDRGDATDSKLNKTIQVISSDLCGTFTNEVNEIRRYCDQQEELNRIKRLKELQKRHQEEADAIGNMLNGGR